MVNQSWKNKPFYWLHLLGIWMHAYADSGAHMYYAGTPAWHINEAHESVYDRTDGQKRLIIWLFGNWYAIKGVEGCAPTCPWPKKACFKSVFYHGHARMGHLPDYPWMKYEYQPMWLSKKHKIVKDNPAEYIRTLKEMIWALAFQNDYAKPLDYSYIDQSDDIFDQLDPNIPKYLEIVRKILEQKVSADNFDDLIGKRCDTWKHELSDGGGLRALGQPSEYYPKSWVEKAKESGRSHLSQGNHHMVSSISLELTLGGISLSILTPLSSSC
jgi:Family of unknown function (DUF6765)